MVCVVSRFLESCLCHSSRRGAIYVQPTSVLRPSSVKRLWEGSGVRIAIARVGKAYGSQWMPFFPRISRPFNLQKSRTFIDGRIYHRLSWRVDILVHLCQNVKVMDCSQTLFPKAVDDKHIPIFIGWKRYRAHQFWRFRSVYILFVYLIVFRCCKLPQPTAWLFWRALN